MGKYYQKMMDDAFGEYYERFRTLNATTKERAVTIAELFPVEKPFLFRKTFRKMLSMEIVKRVGINKYWLDEERANDSNGVLKQRIMIIVVAVIIAVVIILLEKFGIITLG